jgi:arabinose-5-phosphate isomerase
VEEVMTRNPKWIDERDMAVNALQSMNNYRITGMPVLNEKGQVTGSILMQDIIKAGIVR